MPSAALNILNTIIVVVGVPSLVAAFIYNGRQFQRLDALGATMESVKHNLNLCIFALVKMSKIDSEQVVTFSPASLTREGIAHIARVGVKAVLDDPEPCRALFSIIDADEARTRYDVEVAAIKAVLGALVENAHMMRSVKAYLYAHPSQNVMEVAYLAGLYLRDRYLVAHPEIVE